MIESNLVAGRQEFEPGMPREALVRGQSITDACVEVATTEEMLANLAGAASVRQEPSRGHGNSGGRLDLTSTRS